MGKVQYFTIALQKETPIYFSGEVLVGAVMVKITERLKINSLKCSISGDSYVGKFEEKNSIFKNLNKDLNDELKDRKSW